MIPIDMEIVDYGGKVLNEEDIRILINTLKELVKSNGKLNKLRTDDAYLLRFLHSCQFSVAYAYKKMENFYQLLEEYPDWFLYKSPLEQKHLLKRNMRSLLNERDKVGRGIFVCKIGNMNPSKCTMKELAIVDDMWLESALDDPLTQCKGLSIIIDVSGYSYKLLQWLTPTNIKFGMKKVESLPFKELLIHVVNTSFFMNSTIKILWPFIHPKLKENIIFHYNDLDSLHQYISPDVLPPEYGGTANVNYEKLQEKLIESSDDFVAKTKYIQSIIQRD